MNYFKDIIGQEKAKKHLIQSVQQKRVSHTQMFLGKNGYGGLPLAIAYARYVLCENPGENDACGQCNSCKKTDKLIHPDLHFMYPVVKGADMKAPPTSADYMDKWRKAIAEMPYMDELHWFSYAKGELKQGNISAKDCNEAISKFNMHAFENRYKVLILWMPQYLQKSANILLKLLEEPPDYSLFILVGKDESDVLPTIISRAQLLRLPRLDDTEIERGLVEKHQISPQHAAEAALASDGDFYQALQFALHKENNTEHRFHQWFELCREMKKPGKSSHVGSLLKWSDELSKLNREEQKAFLQTGLGFLRNLVVEKAELSINQLQILNELFNRSIYYIERNVNSRILFFDLSVQVNKCLNA